MQTARLSMALVFLACMLTGCIIRYDENLFVPRHVIWNKVKSPLSVTLIDSKKSIENLTFKIGSAFISYNMRDALFSLPKYALQDVYNKAEVSDKPIESNELYAKAIIYTKVPNNKNDLGFVTQEGVLTSVTLDLYETKSNAKVSSISSTVITPYKNTGDGDFKYTLLNLATGFLAVPYTNQKRAENAKKGMDQTMEYNLASAIEDLTNKVSYGKIDSVSDAGIETLLSIKKDSPRDRFRRVDPELKKKSLLETKRCNTELSLKKGISAKYVECLNNAWQDYTIAADRIVQDFKAYRLDLAKGIDSGSLSLEEYEAQEIEAMNRLISKVSYLVWENKSDSNGQPIITLERKGEIDYKNIAPNGVSTGNDKLISGFVEVLGIALELAIKAAPYAIGYAVGVRSVAPIYPTPARVMTCTPLGSGMSSCF